MGMFDDLRCKFPLPLPEFQNNSFQTKDTPAQFLDQYEIREDGTLWREAYDIEDHSELGKWKAANPGKEPPEGWQEDVTKSFLGCMARVNQRWEQVADFTGEIRFYNSLGEHHSGWVEFSAYFVGGRLNQIHLVTHRPADPENEQAKSTSDGAHSSASRLTESQ